MSSRRIPSRLIAKNRESLVTFFFYTFYIVNINQSEGRTCLNF